MSKISNVLYMIELLSNGRKYCLNELSQILEVSPRMIRVYKDEIEKAGIYVDTIKGPYGGYVLNQNICMPKRFVPSKDIVLDDRNIFNVVSKAIKFNKKCSISYLSNNGDVSVRVISPYELLVLNKQWGVAAYCELRNEVRHFYLNRIKTIKII